MLTKEQIDHLFQFCREKGVRPYDVQVELVDHLGSGIEKEMAEHPEWSFEKALDVVFISFGYPNFGPLLKEKKRAARRYCQRLFWSLFKELCYRPDTWVAFGALLYLCQILSFYHVRIGTGVLMPLYFIGIAVVAVGDLRLHKLQRKSGKRFLLINTSGISSLFPSIGAFIWYDGVLWPSTHKPGFILFLGAWIFFYILMSIAYYRMVRRLKRRLITDYPEIGQVA
jgi:hypothetical protein